MNTEIIKEKIKQQNKIYAIIIYYFLIHKGIKLKSILEENCVLCIEDVVFGVCKEMKNKKTGHH